MPSQVFVSARLIKALNELRDQAQSWHDFHHGSQHVQCDAICEALKKVRRIEREDRRLEQCFSRQ